MEQARRLESHIQELLDATRIQFGQLSLELTPLDMRSLVQQVADQTQPLASTQVIHTTLPESPVIVAGDAHRLEQVLVNLLTNAITYAPETERIDLRLATRDGAALITVEDAGPGIPADDLPHIFDRFFHSDSGQSSPGTLSGLGLGLYISREIVSGHGGTIVAQSTLGEGTTFEIRLPLFAADGQDEA
jgi:two-component system CheB/CheR fusion protein